MRARKTPGTRQRLTSFEKLQTVGALANPGSAAKRAWSLELRTRAVAAQYERHAVRMAMAEAERMVCGTAEKA